MSLTGRDEGLQGIGVRDGESMGRFQLLHPEPAVPQGELRVAELDAAIFVRIEDTQVVVLAGAGVVGGVPDLEGNVGHPLEGDRVLLDDLDDRPLVVLEVNRMGPIRVERHQLGLGILQPGGGDGLLRNLIYTRQKVLQDRPAVLVRLNLIHAVAVRCPDGKYGVGHDLAAVCVMLIYDEVRPSLVLYDDLGGLAREQLHMIFPNVDDVVVDGGGLL